MADLESATFARGEGEENHQRAAGKPGLSTTDRDMRVVEAAKRRYWAREIEVGTFA